MKNLRLQKLHLLSRIEKSARTEAFDSRMTVVLGENDTGKSCLIKSIYAAFGADAYKVNPSWQAAQADLMVEFTVNGAPYKILRTGSMFGLFNGDDELVWQTSGITSGVATHVADLLGFKLQLQNRQNELQIPPPAFCFLPFYADQDISWSSSWSSFAGLKMFDKYKPDAVYFHTGLRPNEYYAAKAEKLSAQKVREEHRTERRALDRATKRLRAGRLSIKFDLAPEAFGDRIQSLVDQCRALQVDQEKIQRSLTGLHTKRALLLEQVAVVSGAADDLASDFTYMRAIPDADLICPTCGTHHDNDFANKFGLIGDLDSCRMFLIEARSELAQIDEKIGAEKLKFGEFEGQIASINAVLDEQRGEVKLRDIIQGESERLVDAALDGEAKSIDGSIGEQDRLIDEASLTMSSFEDKAFQKRVKLDYLTFMKKFVFDLNVPGLSENNYKKIDCSISETGSDLPRALLAYYYAIFHTMRKHSTSIMCPIVIDSPVQQDQDPDNAARMIKFALNNVPADMQLILGTVQLHGVDYQGHRIETKDDHALLDTAQFNAVSELFEPFYRKLF